MREDNSLALRAKPFVPRTTMSDLDRPIRPTSVPAEVDRPRSALDRRHRCAAASGVRDGGWSSAIGLQERVANHRKAALVKGRGRERYGKARKGVR
jgi:hypothetical protein